MTSLSPETTCSAARSTRSSAAYHVRCASHVWTHQSQLQLKKRRLPNSRPKVQKRSRKDAAKGWKVRWGSPVSYIADPGGWERALTSALSSVPARQVSIISFCVTPAVPITALSWANAWSYFPFLAWVLFPGITWEFLIFPMTA